MNRLIRVLILNWLLIVQTGPLAAQGGNAIICLFNWNGAQINAFADGNRVRLNIQLPGPAVEPLTCVLSGWPG